MFAKQEENIHDLIYFIYKTSPGLVIIPQSKKGQSGGL